MTAPVEMSGASRAELRRLAGESAAERPAIVWGRPAAAKATDAAIADTAAPAISVPSEPVGEVVESANTAAEPAETPSVPEIVATAVAAATAAVSLPVESAPVDMTAAPVVSRRARRAPQHTEYREITAALDAAIPASAEALVPAPAAEGLSFVAPAVEASAPTVAETPAAAPRRNRVRPQPAYADDAPAVSSALPDPVLTPVEPFELLEPVVSEPVAAEFLVEEPVQAEFFDEEPVAEARHAASGVDEFEAAARLFAFTDETPVQAEAFADAEAEPETVAPDARHKGRKRSPRAAKPAAAPRPAKSKSNSGAAFKRVTTASFSVGVMGVVGLLTVGMTMPTEAVAAATGSDTTSSIIAPGDTGTNIRAGDVQAYVAPSTAEASPLDRSGNYSTASTAQIAQASGIKNFSNFFTNNPNSPIQWPFAVGVPISYGFGWRSGEFHEGVDFTPGAGAPVQAIADGVVRVATYSGGGYGVMVIIDHHIDGQLISSRYAHMEYGSLRVYAGEHIKVGTIIGRTGNTGHSFGAHTHFEILMNGVTPIDPLPWLRAHAGG